MWGPLIEREEKNGQERYELRASVSEGLPVLPLLAGETGVFFCCQSYVSGALPLLLTLAPFFLLWELRKFNPF